MRSAKYLAAYIAPALTIWGLLAGGLASYAAVIFAFVIIPFGEQFLPQSEENLSDDQREDYLASRIFDGLLYLNVPVVYGILALFLYQVNHQNFSTSEWTGLILSVGVTLGACGINVAHELGHRTNETEQLLAKILLLPCLYQHFFIEHNRGHHLHVATPLDPATAHKGELIYTFWFRSLWGSYLDAWQLETKRLQRSKGQVWSWQNEMIRFTVQQALYVTIVFLLSPNALAAIGILLAGLVGVLLLESINYIEHYGLQRKQLANGRYERVQPHHSWNANYQLGRIVLYELTRHSDHHYLASKKYQVLDHHAAAPLLPLGYPASILLALVPPLWFYVMDQELEKVAIAG